MEMPFDVRRRCKALRVASKRGATPSTEDMEFLTECYRKYPDEYRTIGDEAFEETKPFGATETDA